MDQKIALAGKLVALGTSHGGQVVIEHDQKTGGTTKLAGGIAYYPGCDRGTAFARYPLLILVGELDMTDGPRESLANTCVDYQHAANRAGGSDVEEVTYPGAGHSFDVPGVKLQVSRSLNKSVAGYQEAGAKASVAKTLEFLAAVFK